MGTDKRERQRAGRAARIAAAEDAARSAQRRERLTTYAIIGALIVIAIVGIAWLLRDDSDDSATGAETDPGASTDIDGADSGAADLDESADDETSPATSAAAPAEAQPVQITVPPLGATLTEATECPPGDGSVERVTNFAEAPPDCLEPGASYLATIATTKGDISLELDAESAPLAVNNFVVLSRYHYYDGVAFHRVIDDFMVQTGDAVGPTPGQGGPGYSFDDELPGADYVYARGDLAMANSGPATNGGQFFIVTREDGVDWLGGAHTLFGRVTDGTDVVDAIEAADLGDGLGTPTEEILITGITIETT